MIHAFSLVVAAAYGAIVGSFLNVCIYRLPLRKSIVTSRSACARCQRTLAWFENIPIVSYIALRGRCRTCGERISLRYPTIEAITAAMFALGRPCDREKLPPELRERETLSQRRPVRESICEGPFNFEPLKG